MCGGFPTGAVHKLYLLGQWVSCRIFQRLWHLSSLHCPGYIVDKGTLHTAASDVEAALVLCPLKTEVSIPDFARTVFSHREIVSVDTGW